MGSVEFWFFWIVLFHPIEGRAAEIHAYPVQGVCEAARGIMEDVNGEIPGFRLPDACIHIKARPGEFLGAEEPLPGEKMEL